MNKYTLLVAPCQSGKTQKMFNHMLSLFDENQSCINLIFTDNSILQTQQLCSRLNNQDMFDTYKNDDGNLSLVLSSKSNVKDYMNLPYYFMKGYKNVVMCSNSKRVNAIEQIITLFPDYDFNILIDEIDRNIDMFHDKLISWNNKPNIKDILMITATPNRVLLRLGTMKIIKLEKSYSDLTYHKFQDSDFKFFEFDETTEYIDNILDQCESELENNTVWFIPSNVIKSGHYEIKNICLCHDMNCATINSDGNFLWIANPKQKIKFDILPDEELSTTFARIYKTHKLHRKPFAITGMLCISRGITISSESMLITHAILPPKTGNIDSIYQLSARVSGNFKNLSNWKKPKVYCTENLYRRVKYAEDRAISLAERCFKNDQDIIDKYDYTYATSKFLFKQSPAFDTLEKLKEFMNSIGLKQERLVYSRIDGFYVSHSAGRILHSKKINELCSNDRLILSDFNEMKIHSELTTKLKHVDCIVFPVYDDMESTTCDWYVRYRILV